MFDNGSFKKHAYTFYNIKCNRMTSTIVITDR